MKKSEFILRVHGDFGDIEQVHPNKDAAERAAERIVQKGVWREDGMLFPPYRVFYVKVIEK